MLNTERLPSRKDKSGGKPVTPSGPLAGNAPTQSDKNFRMTPRGERPATGRN